MSIYSSFSIILICIVLVLHACIERTVACSDTQGLWVYLDWSSCSQTKYANLQVMLVSDTAAQPNTNVAYGQVRRNATLCIEDEDFTGRLLLRNDSIDQNQQSVFLKTNKDSVSMNIRTHTHDSSGKLGQTFPILIPIKYAFLGPAMVGTKELNSNSPDNEVLSNSRASRVEVSVRYC